MDFIQVLLFLVHPFCQNNNGDRLIFALKNFAEERIEILSVNEVEIKSINKLARVENFGHRVLNVVIVVLND